MAKWARRPGFLRRFLRGLAVAAVAWAASGCGQPQPSSPTRQEGRPVPATPPEWVRFQPPVGNGSADFPGTPREMPKPAASDDTRLFSVADRAGTAYQLGVSKLPPEAASFSVEEKLTRIREATGRGREGTASSARRFDHEGIPAVEYTVVIANNVRLRYFVFLGADYYYVLTLAGTQEAVTSPDAERFFASFRHGS